MANNAKAPLNLRAFASVFAGLSFVIMAVTGLVLFFAPSCRIARGTSWAVWGHGKDQWVAVHIWLSVACIVASMIHIYLNWSALTNYFKDKVSKGLAFRVEWIAALAICVVLYAGSIREVAPFSSLIAWKETFKHPAAGATVSGQGWRRGGAAGQQVQDHATNAQQDHGPGRAGGGMGQKTLRQFCADEGMQVSWAISHLQSRGLTVRDTMTMREVADSLGVHPREIRAVFQVR